MTEEVLTVLLCLGIYVLGLIGLSRKNERPARTRWSAHD